MKLSGKTFDNPRAAAAMIICLVALAPATRASNPIWINPMTCGTPIATYYLGDSLSSPYYINFEIGQASWDYAQVGYGTSAAGTGYNWAVANWYEDGTYPNKRVRRDIGGLKFTATGSWYVICQAKESSGNTYTSGSGCGWLNSVAYPPASMAYFTVNALGNPTVGTLTPASTSITLNWTKWNSKDTLILRSSSSITTDPTQGTGYSAGNTIGGASVIYKSNGTSLNDTPLSANTQYYYKFYAENYSYYSAGVTANAWTLSVAPAAGSVTPDNASPCADSAVTWTAVGGFGAGKIQKYKYAWDQSATHTWTESEADWSSGTLQTTPTAAGTWYLHVKGYNGASPAVANGTYDYSVTANALPTAPDAGYNRGPGATLKILISDLTSDTIQSLGTGSQSATITQDGTHIYYQPQSGNNNNDSFTYTAANTYCTKQGTINVTVVPATGQAQQISVVNGAAIVNFAGIPGYPYIVQRAENSGFTVNVTTVLTTNAPSDGLFICTNSTALPQAYYRLKYNP